MLFWNKKEKNKGESGERSSELWFECQVKEFGPFQEAQVADMYNIGFTVIFINLF